MFLLLYSVVRFLYRTIIVGFLFILSVESAMFRQNWSGTDKDGRSSTYRKQSALQYAEKTETWVDSPWPARNNHVFSMLNNFMERCNDVLELVQSTTHFKMLRLASEIGGAGGTNLNSLVKEIYGSFLEAIEKMKGYNLVNCAKTKRLKFSLIFTTMKNFDQYIGCIGSGGEWN